MLWKRMLPPLPMHRSFNAAEVADYLKQGIKKTIRDYGTSEKV